MIEKTMELKTALDPVTLAVLRGRLEQVADEMDATLYRSAFNPIIAEAHDACHGIYDGISGDTLVQGKSGLPVFVGAMAFAVRAAAKAAATRGGMQDGDIWLFNDPWVLCSLNQSVVLSALSAIRCLSTLTKPPAFTMSIRKDGTAWHVKIWLFAFFT